MLALIIAVGYMLFIGRYCFYVRYIYPVFSLLTIACVGPGLAQAGARRARWVTFALGLGCVAFNLYFMPSAAPIFRVFDYETVVSGEERSKALDASVPERRLVEVVNTVAGDRARVLFVGSPYAAGLWGKAYYANWYGPLFLEQLGEARQPEDVTRLLQQMGITHAIVSRGATLPHPDLFDPVFATHMKLLLNVNGACLYAFNPDVDSSEGHIEVAGGPPDAQAR
jgi:hypothetical protein